MSITIELPEDIERHLESSWPELERKAREAIAVEGYRQGVLSRGQVRRLLDLDYWQTEAFLNEHDALLHYDEEDLEHDRAILDRLPSR